MTYARTLIEKCEALGATFTPLSDRFKIEAPQPLPDELVTQLVHAKSQVLAELRGKQIDKAECWLLEEWRRMSIPDWRQILQDSIDAKDKYREDYARWMLREMLDDPDYREDK
jgi:hypothetical protein